MLGIRSLDWVFPQRADKFNPFIGNLVGLWSAEIVQMLEGHLNGSLFQVQGSDMVHESLLLAGLDIAGAISLFGTKYIWN